MYLVDACMSPSLGAIPAARWTRLHGTIWVWQPLLFSNLLPASDPDPDLSDNAGSEADATDAADGQSEAWIRLTDIPPQLHAIMVSQFADLRWPSSITDATAMADLEMLHGD